MVLGQLPPNPKSNLNPNPIPNREDGGGGGGPIFLGSNCPDTKEVQYQLYIRESYKFYTDL